jgi:6-phosphogluconolactonase
MKRLQQAIGSIFALILLATASASPAATVVYVSNADSKDINVLSLDSRTGDLSPIETATVTAAGPPQAGSMPLAVSPGKKFLYAALRFEPFTVVTFGIEPKTGKLQQLGTAPLPDSMAYIATDRTGKYLLGASYGGHKLSVSPIGPQGTVLANSAIIPTGKNAHAVLTDPSNRYLFATNLGSDAVLQRKFDAKTGAITDNAPAAVITKQGAGPRHFVFHPDKKHVYLINELDGSVYAYRFDAGKGTLSEIQTVSALPPGFQGKPWAADLHITPNGKFLYGTERTSNTIAGFAVDASGKLAPIGSFETEKQPRGFAIDPRGRYLLAVGQVSNGMSVYAIDASSGKLTRLKQYPVGKNPQWIEIIDLP